VEELEANEVELDLWLKMQDEARIDVIEEPILSRYYQTSILSHKSLV
jgi:serine O-acetyltransferase